MTDRDPFHYITWLGARSAGMVAFGLAAAAVIAGLAMSNSKAIPGTRRRYYLSTKDLHEQLALWALVAVGIHAALLLADRWLHPGVVGILVPFTMPYRTFWSGLGILAAYLAVGLGLSYYARRLIGARRWRRLHRFTPVIYVLAAAHMLGAGTDRGTLALRLAVVATAIPITALLALRLAQAYRASGQSRSTREPDPARASLRTARP